VTERAFLGLGSNLGDRVRYLQDAVALLPDVAAVSPVYETDPVGGPDGQGPYLNMVVRLDTTLDAHIEASPTDLSDRLPRRGVS